MIERCLITLSYAILVSCSTYKVTSVHSDWGYDLSHAKTFAWLPDNDTASNNFDNRKIRESFRGYISHKLRKVGLEITTNRVDVLLQVIIRNDQDFGYYKRESLNSGFSEAAKYNYGKYQNQFVANTRNGYVKNLSVPLSGGIPLSYGQKLNSVESTISIQILDPKNLNVVWSSSCTADLITPEYMASPNHPMIDRMLKKCPLGKRKPMRY